MDSNRLSQLLAELCDDSLSPEGEQELCELLTDSPEARQAYCDYVDVHLTMIDHCLASAPGQPETDSVASLLVSDGPQEASLDPIRAERNGSLLTRRTIMGFGLGLAASLMIGFGFFGGQASMTDVAREGTAEDATRGERGPASEKTVSRRAGNDDALFLAQVTEVSPSTEWASPASSDFLLRLSRGDRIDIAAGSIRIDYFAGASLVLEGPCAFAVTGRESGRLQSGRLTGEVSVGEFLLTTPTARVLDLGTEFGVSVDTDSRTDVCVFDGEVEVSAEHGSRDASIPVRLKRGRAASVARGGRIVEIADADEARYLRSLPSTQAIGAGGGSVSLVDVLAARQDTTVALAAVIAPDTGLPDRHPWLRPDGPGYSMSGGYQTASWHRFVDGVFIPPCEGGPTTIDSRGTLVRLGPSTGRTWGPVWSRRRAAGAIPAEGHEDYWGTDTLQGVAKRFATCRDGMIGVHSNVGVTIDLEALTEACGKAPTRFSGLVCNLDNSLSRLPEWASGKRFTAHFHVFVDGQLREVVESLSRDAGDVPFSVDLSPGDRFLTIVTTDDGERDENGISTTTYADAYDHLVLIDPSLTLAP